MEQIRKINSQKKGSVLDGIKDTVASAMANPKRESRKIIFQFISKGLIYKDSSITS